MLLILTYIQYSFWGVASLRILDLERNNITHINSDNFKGQEKLHELNLSGNRLGVARIPSGTFLHLTVRKLISTEKYFRFITHPCLDFSPFFSRSFLSFLPLSEISLESAHTATGGEQDRRAQPANLSEFKESPISRPKWQSTRESSARCFSRHSGKANEREKKYLSILEFMSERSSGREPSLDIYIEIEKLKFHIYILCRPPQSNLRRSLLSNMIINFWRFSQELKTFKCRQCSLKQIKPELFNMIPKLNELNLGSNQFKHFDNELNAMRNLRNLILDHNQIHEISNRLFSFHHKSLEHLGEFWRADDVLKNICVFWHGPSSFSSLDLSRNGLIRISDKAFHNLINLTHLDISYNKFTTDDFHSVKKLKTLKALNISGNVNLDLSQTSEVFTSLTNLQQLSIADIVSTPVDFFSYVSQLTSLNISGANLRNDSLLILNPLTKLVELDLSRNAIKGFSDELADKLVDIGNVILEKNPIICDVCKMEALHNRVNEVCRGRRGEEEI